MIKTAVILAAGTGKRIPEVNVSCPKGFITLGKVPIIEESIQKLLSAGIEKIIIGVGFKSEFYYDLAQNYPEVICLKNHQYVTTGSMGTLYCLKNFIYSDFLLLESDLIYDFNGLNEIIKCSFKDVILASDRTYSNDEVFIETDGEEMLKNMSKNENLLDKIDGELVGISKLSKDTYSSLCSFYESIMSKKTDEIHYEETIVGIAEKHPFYVLKLADYLWGEIDDFSHLARCRNLIYPKLEIINHGK